MSTDQKTRWFWLVPFILFYLGWVKFMAPGVGPYYVDYALRLVMLVFIWPERHILLEKPSRPKFWLIGLYVVVLVFYIWSDEKLYSNETALAFDQAFFKTSTYPAIHDPVLFWFDMTIGLMMVAITEEYIYRYKLNEVLKGLHKGLAARYLITAILFSLIHLPQGMISLGQTFLWGLFLFYLYQKSRSLQFVIILHFLTNFVVFGLL
ncbi:MAG: CPBP family intramembrane metalloprotease [Methylocystaceae bacterium]|nr:CPBP family intramembrane metalloprotease [Methylocystaceae bacterium]